MPIDTEIASFPYTQEKLSLFSKESGFAILFLAITMVKTP